MAKSSTFVWRSTPASVSSDTPSIFAIAEIAVAVTAYWVLWTLFEIHTHLWISLFIAPLLLLRSDASVEKGVKWAETYMAQRFIDADNIDGVLLRKIIIWECVRPLVGVLITYIVLTGLFPFQTKFGNAFWGLFIGYLSGQFYMAITVAARPEELLFMSQKIIYVVIGTSIALVAVVVTAILSRLDPIPFTAFVSGAGITILSAAVIVARSRSFFASLKHATYPVEAIEMAPASMTIFSPGIMLGGWMRSLGIRILATLRHLREGWWALPTNWWRTLFVFDIFVTPEIIPGYKRQDLYNINYYFERIRTGNAAWRKILYVICALAFFMPAYLYRLSIKSTFWAYYGLAFVVTGTQYVRGHVRGQIKWARLRHRPRILMNFMNEDHTRSRWRWVMIILGLGGLVIGNSLIVAKKTIDLPFKIPFSIEYLFLVDLSTIRSWQVVGILVALLTLGVSRKTGDLRIDIQNAREGRTWLKPMYTTAGWLVCFLRLRNAVSRTLIVMIALHAILWLSPVQNFLPAPVIDIFRDIYGDAMPPPPG